jgi:hypothetical protein
MPGIGPAPLGSILNPRCNNDTMLPMATDSDVEKVVDALVAELNRDKSLTRRRMYEVSLEHLGEDECTNAEGGWAIPLPVLALFRAKRPVGAKWNVDDEIWALR